jgi:hypothetical protein
MELYESVETFMANLPEDEILADEETEAKEADLGTPLFEFLTVKNADREEV